MTGENCDQCTDAKFTGDGCDECVDARFTGAECDECADARFTGPECDECADARFTGAECDECADARFTGEGCDECADARFTGEGCDECADTRFTGEACAECADARFKGEDCDECADPRFSGEGCDECADANVGGAQCDHFVFRNIDIGNYLCGTLATGQVLCWGDNAPDESRQPSGAHLEVRVGSYFHCTRSEDGIECTGEDEESTAAPDGSYVTMDLQSTEGCALDANGALVCWGPDVGELYFQTELGARLFDPERTYDHLALVTNGGVGVDQDGEIYGWGDAPVFEGDFGDEPIVRVRGGDPGFCAINMSNEVYCDGMQFFFQEFWGKQDGNFRDVCVGWRHICGLTLDGDVDCWGSNDSGEGEDQTGPFESLVCDGAWNCAIGVDGRASCWGSDVPPVPVPAQ